MRRPLRGAAKAIVLVGVCLVLVLRPQAAHAGGSAAAADACPIRAMSAFRLVPLAAASVAAVCLKSWKRKSEIFTARHARRNA